MKTYTALVAFALVAVLGVVLATLAYPPQPCTPYTIAWQESPPFSTCMEQGGQVSKPLPSTQTRKSWSAAAQESYRVTYWNCFHAVTGK